MGKVVKVSGPLVVATGMADALLQRALDAVIDVLDHAGAQLHAHGGAGGHHLGARAQAGGLLVDLDGGGVAVHGEDLTDETLGTHAHHVGHIGVRHAGGHHQGAGDLNSFSQSPFWATRTASWASRPWA